MNTVERPIVAKFGGTSMADASTIRMVADIIQSNEDRCFVIPSAPGNNAQYPEKSQRVTNLLETAYFGRTGAERRNAFDLVEYRFVEIGRELEVPEVGLLVAQVHQGIELRRERGITQEGLEWSSSRGEWVTGQILASFLGATFVDAVRVIKIKDGQIDPSSYDLVGGLTMEKGRVVIPGYYGLNEKYDLVTLKKGGSDVTGAIVARGSGARAYENWKDVDGVYTADPRWVASPRVIACLTYDEMREIGVRGGEVLQRNTILPLISADQPIPINVRNTFNPLSEGTMIMANREIRRDEDVVGIAVDEGPYVSFKIQKHGMGEEIGIGRDILETFSALGIPYEHTPDGRDYMSVLLNQRLVNGTKRVIVDALSRTVEPNKVTILRDLGLLSLVGEGIQSHPFQVAGRLFSALSGDFIEGSAISFGAGISMVAAVSSQDLLRAVEIAHKLFIK